MRKSTRFAADTFLLGSTAATSTSGATDGLIRLEFSFRRPGGW